MTRYFYTDPLAAAWMAKHFGMKLWAGNFLILPETVNNFLWLVGGDHMPVSSVKCIIHSDSLYLLEPKYKDLLVGPNTMAAMFYMDDSDKEPSKRCRIIARNGISFMWPESEAA